MKNLVVCGIKEASVLLHTGLGKETLDLDAPFPTVLVMERVSDPDAFGIDKVLDVCIWWIADEYDGDGEKSCEDVEEGAIISHGASSTRKDIDDTWESHDGGEA